MLDADVKKQLLRELEKSGNVYRACLKVGIDRSTFYRWKENDEDFRNKAEEAERGARANNCDVAEHALMANVRKGDMGAIRFVLSHNSPIYRNPMPPPLKMFEDFFPGEGLGRLRIAMALKRKFKKMGGIPPKPGGADMEDVDLQEYEEYINEWYRKALSEPLFTPSRGDSSKSAADKVQEKSEEPQPPETMDDLLNKIVARYKEERGL